MVVANADYSACYCAIEQLLLGVVHEDMNIVCKTRSLQSPYKFPNDSMYILTFITVDTLRYDTF